MRRLLFALLLLPMLLLAGESRATSNTLIVDPTTTLSKTCPADGTTAPSISLTAGLYTWFVTVQSETVFLCRAATCASGGVPLVVGTQLKMDFQGTPTISCRSPTGAGILVVNPSAI